ncbi:hypothetical protein [Marinobacterium litorale]|uniref:hypothetical protein n=1 Tax=Marinobacterium litorale TaxID=404770 RepID=UPI0012ECA043|nr:hypothetical protein [Marinobacterium litorale]
MDSVWSCLAGLSSEERYFCYRFLALPGLGKPPHSIYRSVRELSRLCETRSEVVGSALGQLQESGLIRRVYEYEGAGRRQGRIEIGGLLELLGREAITARNPVLYEYQRQILIPAQGTNPGKEKRVSGLRRRDRWLLAMLLEYADQFGLITDLAMSQIERLMGLDKLRVRNQLRRLERLGFISIVARGFNEATVIKHQTSIYLVNLLHVEFSSVQYELFKVRWTTHIVDDDHFRRVGGTEQMMAARRLGDIAFGTHLRRGNVFGKYLSRIGNRSVWAFFWAQVDILASALLNGIAATHSEEWPKSLASFLMFLRNGEKFAHADSILDNLTEKVQSPGLESSPERWRGHAREEILYEAANQAWLHICVLQALQQEVGELCELSYFQLLIRPYTDLTLTRKPQGEVWVLCKRKIECQGCTLQVVRGLRGELETEWVENLQDEDRVVAT